LVEKDSIFHTLLYTTTRLPKGNSFVQFSPVFTHVNRVVSSCFYQLRRIKSSVKALPLETAKTLVNCFVV